MAALSSFRPAAAIVSCRPKKGVRTSLSCVQSIVHTFSCGRTPAMTFVSGMPTNLATALAVVSLSPEIIHVPMPWLCKRLMTDSASGRRGSATANKPNKENAGATADSSRIARRTTLFPSDFHASSLFASRPSMTHPFPVIQASLPMMAEHFIELNSALRPLPGISSKDVPVCEDAPFSEQYCRMAAARG